MPGKLNMTAKDSWNSGHTSRQESQVDITRAATATRQSLTKPATPAEPAHAAPPAPGDTLRKGCGSREESGGAWAAARAGGGVAEGKELDTTSPQRHALPRVGGKPAA